MTDTLRKTLVAALADIVRERIDAEIAMPWLRLQHEREELEVSRRVAREVEQEARGAAHKSAKYIGRNADLDDTDPAPVPDVFAIATQTAERLADYLIRNELADRSASAARKVAAEIDKVAAADRAQRRRINNRIETLRAELAAAVG